MIENNLQETCVMWAVRVQEGRVKFCRRVHVVVHCTSHKHGLNKSHSTLHECPGAVV